MGTHLDLAAWSALTDLCARLDDSTGDLAAIGAYARRWMCQGAGFEPSPLCLLRPLARVLDEVAQAFLDVERLAVADLLALRDGLAATGDDLALVDSAVAATLAGLPEVA